MQKDHPNSIVALVGYIYVKIMTGRLDEAESDCLRVLDIIAKDKVSSVNGRWRLAVVDHLSTIYGRQERRTELEVLKAEHPAIQRSSIFNIWQS